MSILIKGMEMPTEQYGKMVITLYPNGHVAEYVGDMERVWEAVPVPPHGLIDREQILDSIRLELAQANAVNDMEDYDAWMRVFDYVRKFPAIIPAEEGET